MIKQFLIICSGLTALVALTAYTSKRNKRQQENHPPVVKITSPKNNSFFTWDTQFGYAITVSDKEDGDSRFDEINAREVLLKITYVPDEKTLNAELAKGNMPDAPGLALLRHSNCFNCHNFNSKLIGPSFYDIVKHYPATPATTTLLAKRMREGSTGEWGKVTMPTHPEFTQRQAETIIQWIMDNSASKDTQYYTGTQGNLRIKQPATGSSAYILIASYTDHGLKDVPGSQRLRGEDVVVVRGK